MTPISTIRLAAAVLALAMTTAGTAGAQQLRSTTACPAIPPPAATAQPASRPGMERPHEEQALREALAAHAAANQSS